MRSQSFAGGSIGLEDELPSGVHSSRKVHDGGCSVIDFSMMNGQLATGGNDGAVKIWDSRNLEGGKSFKLPYSKSISAVKFNTNGNLVACAGSDLAISLLKVSGSSIQKSSQYF